MVRSSTRRKKPGPKKDRPTSFVERALNGMTERLETGATLSDREVPLYLMMLHAHNSREMLNYMDLFHKMEDRLNALEGRLNTAQNLRQAMDSSRRVPNPNVGPPNQDPFAQRNM